MALELAELEKKLKELSQRRAEAQQLFHELGGAIDLLQWQIKNTKAVEEKQKKEKKQDKRAQKKLEDEAADETWNYGRKHAFESDEPVECDDS